MASGAFAGGIDPKKALLLAPLASSTASLVFGWDQHLFLSLLTAAPHGEAVLPGYWRALFPRGVAQVLALLSVTAGASAGAAWAHGGLLRRTGSLGWYAAAGVLALGHLGFVPAVAGRIRDLLERADGEGAGAGAGAGLGDVNQKGVEGEEGENGEEKKKEEKSSKSNVELQREWLQINLVRTLTTDLGAWVCAFVAAVKTFS